MKDLETDIRRALTSWGFWAAFGGMIVAIIIGASGDILPIIQQGAEDGLQTGFHAQALLSALSSDVMLLCVPILAALPYTSAFVDDIKSGYLKVGRFLFYRMKNLMCFCRMVRQYVVTPQILQERGLASILKK